MLKKYFKNNKRGGFTIIETMISVALFLTVVMTGMGALLNASSIHDKSQNMRSVMDNLNFIMEDMSRNIRTGYDYWCDSNSSGRNELPTASDPLRIPQDCPDGGWALVFEPSKGDPSDNSDQWIYAFITNSDGTSKLVKSVNGGGSGTIGTDYVQLNPDEIEFDPGSGFTVIGTEANSSQPLVTIRLIGKIFYKKDKTSMPFSIQTSVSQRLINIQK